MILRRVVAALVMPVALVAAIAWAVASEDPAGTAKKTLSDLEAKRAAPALSGAANGTAKALEVASQPIAEARKMLARANELRGLGDVTRAELAEDTALEWALTARELVRAVELETDGRDQAIAADDAGTRAARARALLEEAIARRAKLQKDLDALEKESETRALDAGPADAKKKAP
jgi:hypothetical protein